MSLDRQIHLSDAHLSRIAASEGPLHDPAWRLLGDADLDDLARNLLAGRKGPVPLFAYGSLIWNPGIPVQSRRRAQALGWQRRFSILLEHFRGSPERPGLMLALAQGGRCDGVVLEISEGTEAQSLRDLLRRELVAHELSANARWITVQTERGTEEALTFYADPVGTKVVEMALHDQARQLARASGSGGTGAEYLLRTVEGLADLGIYDEYIWSLQRLVAEEIDASPR